MGLLSKLLGSISGNNDMKVSEQLLFDKVIGFRNIVPGCGASTIVQNIAIALSEKTKFNICILDTNFLYPVQYPLLCNTDLKAKEPDILDFAGDLSVISRNTSYANVYLVQLENRTIIDLLSGKDAESIIPKLMATLKSYFDIVIVDLSYELSNISTYSAIKCNKIYQVADTSMKCLYYIKKSLNSMVTLGVPLAKGNKVILNKELDDVVLGVDTALQEAGLTVVTRIPFSYDLAVSGASGKRIYGAMSKSKDISSFNVAIEDIIKDMLEKTPLNSEYMDVAKELAKMEKAQEETKKASEGFVEEYEDSGEYMIEELPDLDEEENTETNVGSDINLNKDEVSE